MTRCLIRMSRPNRSNLPRIGLPETLSLMPWAFPLVLRLVAQLTHDHVYDAVSRRRTFIGLIFWNFTKYANSGGSDIKECQTSSSSSPAHPRYSLACRLLLFSSISICCRIDINVSGSLKAAGVCYSRFVACSKRSYRFSRLEHCQRQSIARWI